MENERRELKGFILSQIKERGPIPFSQFMEWCLYHPDYGYYRSGRTRIGIDGDYYSSPCVHPLFGYLIAKQLSQMAEILESTRFDVVEMGAGRGWLGEDILNWAQKSQIPFYNHLEYTLIEKNSSFVKEQKERLAPYTEEGKVLWMDPEEMENGKKVFEGCFLSNELVDAFPVHRVTVDQGSLREAYVTQKNGQFEEEWGELSDPRLSSYFESMGITLQEGQKAEVNLKALDWMETVGRHLKRGFVLTIDYGYVAQELYASARREGTLLCYFRNRTSEDPYKRVGEQDITSHVNFTALIQKGEQAGLRFTGFVPQYRFLIALGILQEMMSFGEKMPSIDELKLCLSLKHLIDPDLGMGEVCKVLIQHKRVAKPQLDGLRDLESVPWPSPEERER
jgi:SAM-dependent MidA family methyltransferase